MKNKIKMLLNSIEILYDGAVANNVDFTGRNQYDIVHELIDVIEESAPREVIKLKVVKND